MQKLSRRLTLTLALGGALAADKDLVVCDWSGYEGPGFHPKYVEKNGDSSTFAFFGDEDEAFEKIRSGFKSGRRRPGGAEGKGLRQCREVRHKTLFQSPLPSELKLKMIAEFEKIKAGY